MKTITQQSITKTVANLATKGSKMSIKEFKGGTFSVVVTNRKNQRSAVLKARTEKELVLLMPKVASIPFENLNKTLAKTKTVKNIKTNSFRVAAIVQEIIELKGKRIGAKRGQISAVFIARRGGTCFVKNINKPNQQILMGGLFHNHKELVALRDTLAETF